jgi:hypothetical protein
MVPSRVPIVDPSTCKALCVKACNCRASKGHVLHTMMFYCSIHFKSMKCYLKSGNKNVGGWCLGNGPF